MIEWDMTKVFERVQEAARTLRHTPPVRREPKQTHWPDFVRSYWEAYQDDAAPLRPRPTPKQLKELDQVIAWMAWLHRAGPEFPRIVWARAATRASWRKLGQMTGRSHTKAMHDFRAGVALLMYGLRDGALEGEPRRDGDIYGNF
jgi:hypothetical protein